jgi:hypothetical protein
MLLSRMVVAAGRRMTRDGNGHAVRGYADRACFALIVKERKFVINLFRMRVYRCDILVIKSDLPLIGF